MNFWIINRIMAETQLVKEIGRYRLHIAKQIPNNKRFYILVKNMIVISIGNSFIGMILNLIFRKGKVR